MFKKTYMHSLSYSFDEKSSVVDYYNASDLASSREALLSAGYSDLLLSKTDLVEMLKSAAIKTLKCFSGLVDCVVIVSSSFVDFKEFEVSLERMLEELCIGHAHVHLSTLSQCSNFSNSISLCDALIKSDKYSNILLIFADKFDSKTGPQRNLYDNSVLLSDGSAACIISNAHFGVSAYEVMGVDLYSDKSCRLLDASGFPSDALDASRRFIAAHKKLSTFLGEQHFDYLVTNNYSAETVAEIIDFLNPNFSVLYTASIEKYAHTYSADPIFSLSDLAQHLECGNTALIATTGVTSWGVVLLKYIEGRSSETQ
ncbi:hypothetical protein [Pseudomonas sp.]|uniref:hypothetical protein n=1 Tax=Pseudomonas sp. TaxID=306 RepID=UPI003C7230BA